MDIILERPSGNCIHCYYWDGKRQQYNDKDHIGSGYTKGRCKRHAPEPRPQNGVWPITESMDWCGDFLKA